MPAITSHAIVVGRETVAYGTKATTLTRGYEGKADSWKKTIDFQESVGLRAGQQAVRTDRHRGMDMGGEGSLEVDVLTSGFGMLLNSMLPTTSVVPVQIGATPAYKTTVTTSDNPPTESFSVQVQRQDTGGTVRSFTHLGAICTGWTLAQSVSDVLTATVNFDFQTVNTSDPKATPAYPVGTPFDWTMTTVTLGGSPICVNEFSLEADMGLNTDRRCLNGTGLKKEPIRGGLPSYTGNMTAEFQNMDAYNAFVAGTVQQLVVEWKGAEIGTSGEYPMVTITIPAVKFTGESPEVSVDDLPSQPMPFTCLYNGTDPVIKIEYISEDTAL